MAPEPFVVDAPWLKLALFTSYGASPSRQVLVRIEAMRMLNIQLPNLTDWKSSQINYDTKSMLLGTENPCSIYLDRSMHSCWLSHATTSHIGDLPVAWQGFTHSRQQDPGL